MAKPKTNHSRNFARRIGAKETRKLRARREKHRTIWMGFSMFGLVGWSVVIPCLLGAALGYWLDNKRPGTYSWTLMLMLLGLGLGCLNAWRWVNREREGIQNRRDADKEK